MFQLVQILRIRPHTSSRTRVSETGATSACEPELLTIHITDNHTKSLEHMQALQGRGKPQQKCGSSRSKQRALYESCRSSTKNKFFFEDCLSVGKWIIRYEDDHTCDNPQPDSVTAMKLKIKDLDYMKKRGQQSRTTSTQSCSQ